MPSTYGKFILVLISSSELLHEGSITSKIFKIIASNNSMSQSQQQTQATDMKVEEIRTNINLPYIEGTSKKLQRKLKSNKKRSTFYTESTLHNLLCKPKDRVATEGKNNIVHESEAVYFRESKRSLKSRSDERKGSVRNCDCEKNEIAKQ